MTAIATELENTLRDLDPQSASSLERVVWDVLMLAKKQHGNQSAPHANSEMDVNGYPSGHFERLAGSWKDVEFALPEDPPPGSSPDWS